MQKLATTSAKSVIVQDTEDTEQNKENLNILLSIFVFGTVSLLAFFHQDLVNIICNKILWTLLVFQLLKVLRELIVKQTKGEKKKENEARQQLG